jgi:ribosomal protein L32
MSKERDKDIDCDQLMICPFGDIGSEGKRIPRSLKIAQWYKCPNCGQKIIPQPWLKNIKTAHPVSVACGHCNKDNKGNKKGIVTIKLNNE